MSQVQATSNKDRSVHALEATNFFLADVQTGLGPFLAAYLAGSGWNPGRVGVALTVGGAITVLLQTPAGAVVDRVRSKRAILIAGSVVLAVGAILLSTSTAVWSVYTAQILIGGAAPFLAPTLAAITLGIVGRDGFDRLFGKNQGFNSAGNVACALLIALVSRMFGDRAIFLTAAALTLPTMASVLLIRGRDIDYALARGGRMLEDHENAPAASVFQTIVGDRVLMVFLVCAFLFHLPMRPCCRSSARCWPKASREPRPRSCPPASS